MDTLFPDKNDVDINRKLNILLAGLDCEQHEMYLLFIKKFAPFLSINILESKSVTGKEIAELSLVNSTEAHDCLTTFALEHLDSYTEEDLTRFSTLLLNKGLKFTEWELIGIVNLEINKQNFLKFKEIISNNCSSNLRQCLYKFALNYGSDIRRLKDYGRAMLIFRDDKIPEAERIPRLTAEDIDIKDIDKLISGDFFNSIRLYRDGSLKLSFLKELLKENKIELKYSDGDDISDEALIDLIINTTVALEENEASSLGEGYIEKSILWVARIINYLLSLGMHRVDLVNLKSPKSILRESLCSEFREDAIVIDYLEINDLICCIRLDFDKTFPEFDKLSRVLVSYIYHVFREVATVDIILISCYRIFIDEKGWEHKACFASVKARREIASSLNRNNLTPEKILSHFDLRSRYRETNKGISIGSIESHEDVKESYGNKSSGTIDVHTITPEQFELLIADLLNKMGFRVEHTGKTGDGGIDIKAELSTPLVGGRFIIQCKRYSEDTKVDVKDIRDLFGVIHSEMAGRGILITTSSFTSKAIDFANGKPIELIDGEKLEKLLQQHLG